MCKTEISLYPESILRNKAKDILDFSDEKVHDLIRRLLATMDSYSHCVGLAANQIGSNLNVFVADASKNSKCESKHGRIVVVNPILRDLKIWKKSREGCMSVPDFTGDVSRAEFVRLDGFDQEGQKLSFEGFGFEARVFQHEVDHLNGKVFLDRVETSREVHSRKNYRK